MNFLFRLVPQIKLGRTHSTQSGMRTIGIIAFHIVSEYETQLAGSVIFVDVDVVVLEGPEEPFCPCVVQALAFAVHGYLHSGSFDLHNTFRVRKMAALVAVDDFWLPKS